MKIYQSHGQGGRQRTTPTKKLGSFKLKQCFTNLPLICDKDFWNSTPLSFGNKVHFYQLRLPPAMALLSVSSSSNEQLRNSQV